MAVKEVLYCTSYSANNVFVCLFDRDTAQLLACARIKAKTSFTSDQNKKSASVHT